MRHFCYNISISPFFEKIMSDCITPDDVLSFPACCNIADQICCPYEVIENEICCAIDLIEQITCTKICPYEDCKVFNGTGNCKLYFTPVTSEKLIELHSIEENFCDDSCGCSCSGLGDQEPENCDNWLEYRCDGYFPCGSKNIQICGIWGSFTEIPPVLKKIAIQMTLESIQPGITGIETSQGMIDSVTWDDFSINYNTADVDVNVPSTGITSIDRQLRSFIPTSSQIKFAVIEDDCGDCRNINNYKGHCKCHRK